MTNQETSPEAVERLSPETHADKFDPSTGGYVVTFEKYAALSAALEVERVANGHEKRMRLDVIAMEQAATARAEAAEAERDALKAELAEAVGALQKIESRPDKMTWGEDYEVSEAMRDMEETARAALRDLEQGKP